MALELIKGKNLLVFFRERSKHATEDGAKLRFQTEHSVAMSMENEAIITKDGVINNISEGENTADITSLAYVDDDATMTTWETLFDCYKRGVLMEMWEVDVTKVTPENLNIKPYYYQGYFTEFEKSAPADGQVELSYSFAINGVGVKGDDVLSLAQVDAVKNALYEYEKILATEETEPGV